MRLEMLFQKRLKLFCRSNRVLRYIFFATLILAEMLQKLSTLRSTAKTFGDKKYLLYSELFWMTQAFNNSTNRHLQNYEFYSAIYGFIWNLLRTR